MKKNMMMMAAALGTVAMLAGCGKQPTPGTEAYLEWAKDAKVGSFEFSKAKDGDAGRLDVGNHACEVMGSAASFGSAVTMLMDKLSSYQPTREQIEDMLRQTTVNLCPQYKDKLP